VRRPAALRAWLARPGDLAGGSHPASLVTFCCRWPCPSTTSWVLRSTWRRRSRPCRASRSEREAAAARHACESQGRDASEREERRASVQVAPCPPGVNCVVTVLGLLSPPIVCSFVPWGSFWCGTHPVVVRHPLAASLKHQQTRQCVSGLGDRPVRAPKPVRSLNRSSNAPAAAAGRIDSGAGGVSDACILLHFAWQASAPAGAGTSQARMESHGAASGASAASDAPAGHAHGACGGSWRPGWP
jgi:hypothetical protein